MEIVESASPLWELPGEGWGFALDPTIEIRSDPGEPTRILHLIGRVERLVDGRVVLENNGSERLLVYDSLGRFERSHGRPGQGPGEFDGLLRFFACTGDTLVVQDRYRAHFYRATHGFTRTVRVRERLIQGSPPIEAVAEDCSSLLVIYEAFVRPPPGVTDVVRFPTAVFWMDLMDGSRDTVGVFPGLERLPITDAGGLRGATSFAFGVKPQWTSDGRFVYYGPADRFEVRVLDRAGRTVRVIRWAAEPERITDAEWDRVFAANDSVARENPRLMPYNPTGDRHPRPEFAPAYSELRVDSEGHLWVRQYAREGSDASVPDEGPRWWVFDSAGRWLGELETPDGLDVRSIRGDLVLGIWRDEFDVEEVRAYRILGRDIGDR